jgi:hypothetical protein
VWQENDPLSAAPWYDVGVAPTYTNTLWTTPYIQPNSDMARFRLWDMITSILSNDPHGLIITVFNNFGVQIFQQTWTWAQISSGTLPLSHVRAYCGQMGEGFFITVQDISDVSSITGQGASMLGLTVAIGIAGGNFKLAPSVTK